MRLSISGYSNYDLNQGFALEEAFNCPVKLAADGKVRSILSRHYINSYSSFSWWCARLNSSHGNIVVAEKMDC